MRKITIRTPENIEFEYELAGAGSRFLAIFLDTLFKSGALLLIIATLNIVSHSLHLDIFGKTESLLKSSLTLSILFLGALAGFIMVGYHIFFEILRNGQTPGKKIAGLRVIKENGASVTIIESAIRNFLRVIDVIPGCYVLGTIAIMASRHYKRIGDLAAGTLVVKITSDLPPVLFPDMEVESPETPPDIARLDEEDYQLIRNFLARRSDLRTDARKRLARKISDIMIGKMKASESPFTAEEDLLEWIAVGHKSLQNFPHP